MYLISLNGISQIIGVPQNTVEKWIKDFSSFIPKSKLNHAIYFELEAIEVFTFIKDCFERNYEKLRIRRMLANTNFVLTINPYRD
ncbi:MerR family transcriptional regulator [Oceanobacillus massiliensis]|uniref:MerR family transcriptional regulator n=1 Tax=Oceanobacillus massiliensis TaxID=1465765 RepID=UPI00301813A6